jgi:hypothetical protein
MIFTMSKHNKEGKLVKHGRKSFGPPNIIRVSQKQRRRSELEKSNTLQDIIGKIPEPIKDSKQM